MLAFLALLAASTSSPGPQLESAMPWFERISVTVDGHGKQQSCLYQFSLNGSGPVACDEAMASSIPAVSSKGSAGLYSKLTFERRFSPGTRLDSGRLQAGDKLLGQQVMFLTIAADGSIDSCKIVGSSGDLTPTYGCDEAKAEQFRAAASAAQTPPRQAFMTIRVFGHQEQIA